MVDGFAFILATDSSGVTFKALMVCVSSLLENPTE